jgi:hypothetical protein
VNTSGAAAKAAGIGGAYSTNTARSIETEAAETVQPIPAYKGPVSGFFEGKDGIITRLDHPGAGEFSRNPPALPPVNRNIGARGSQGPAFTGCTVGDYRQFWVQIDSGNTDNWKEITAGLRASSTHANIWIPEENYNPDGEGENRLSPAEVQAIADKFDLIYKYDTAIFGYEYGGNPNRPDEYGGVDGDPKIQILVYDINGDYEKVQNSGVFGYFWAKDFTYGAGEGYHPNQAEMFYIDSHFAAAYPEAIYSTLVHEFQHMINFNVKYIEKGRISDTWYDEMLSMLAEDMICPLIGISSSNGSHPIPNRIPLFLSIYWYAGPTEWLAGNDVLISYSNTYAFGAYLARNYGGAELVREIAGNNMTGVGSVDAALKKYGSSWDGAVKKYGEAFIFSGSSRPSDGASFDKTVTNNIGGTEYTFAAFDIWKMKNNHSNYLGASYNSMIINSPGPVAWDSGYSLDMPGYSVLVRSNADWMNVSGNITITLVKPDNPGVELFLMSR